MSNFEIRTSGGGVGAFVDGINLANDLSDNVVGALRSALGEHGALYFRDQKLTPDDQIAFAEKFGEININLFFAHVDGYPKIAQVLKEPDQKKNIGGGWHTDHTYDLEPAMASMLHALASSSEYSFLPSPSLSPDLILTSFLELTVDFSMLEAARLRR